MKRKELNLLLETPGISTVAAVAAMIWRLRTVNTVPGVHRRSVMATWLSRSFDISIDPLIC